MLTTVTVEAPGRLDAMNSGEFAALVENLIEAGAHRLILDLGALQYLSSAGVRALLLIHKAIGQKQGKLALLSCRSSAAEVLRICGLENLAPRAEGIEAARRWVQ
jgi:anti-anti-sigma factor